MACQQCQNSRMAEYFIKLVLPLLVFVALVIWYFGQRKGE